MMLRRQVFGYERFSYPITGVIHDEEAVGFIWLLGDKEYVYLTTYKREWERGITTLRPVDTHRFDKAALIKHRIIEDDKPKMYRYKLTTIHDTGHPSIKRQKTSVVVAESLRAAEDMIRSKSVHITHWKFIGKAD